MVFARPDNRKNHQNVSDTQKVQAEAKDDEASLFHARPVAKARFIPADEAQSRAARQFEAKTAWQDPIHPKVVEELPKSVTVETFCSAKTTEQLPYDKGAEQESSVNSWIEAGVTSQLETQAFETRHHLGGKSEEIIRSTEYIQNASLAG